MDYPLGYDELTVAVEREAAALTAALRSGDDDLAVPSCPGWTQRDLAEHVGGFCGFWSHVVCDGARLPKTVFADPPPGSLVDWFATMAADLLGSLRATPPETEIWTWVAEDSSAHFAANRAAHELAIHRFDAQLALGAADPVEPRLAAAGIDEIFLMIPNRKQVTDASVAVVDDDMVGRTLHLHATDVQGEWTATLRPIGLEVARVHGKADCAVKGSASDLELLLYRRPLLGEVESFGDAAVLDAFYRSFTF